MIEYQEINPKLPGGENDSEKKAQEFLDLYVDKNIDEVGNLQSFANTVADPRGRDVAEYIRVADFIPLAPGSDCSGDERALYDLAASPELLLVIEKIFCDRNSPLINKVVLANLLTEIDDDLFFDDEAAAADILEMLQKVATNSETPYFLKIYILSLINESAMVLARREFRPDDNTREEMHEPVFDRFEFEFDGYMAGKLLADLKSLAESSQAPDVATGPVKLVNDSIDGPYYEGDYITAHLAPNIVGVYSRKGDLVGWTNITAEMKKKMTEEIDFTEYHPEALKSGHPEEVYPWLAKMSPAGIEGEITGGSLELRDQLPLVKDRRDLALFKIIESLPIRQTIKSELGIDTSKLFLREQYQLLKFLAAQDNGKIERVKKFFDMAATPEGRMARATAFLSLEEDAALDEKILDIGEKMSNEAADKIFLKYQEIVALVGQIESYLQENFPEITEKDVNIAQKDLLRVAKDLLVNFADKTKDAQPEKILEGLNRVRANTLLFATCFKEASKNSEIRFKDIKGVSFETRDATEIAPVEKDIMEEIFVTNRSDYPKKLLTNSIKEFRDEINSEAGRVYSCKKDGELISFAVLTPLSEDKFHFGFFNVPLEIQRMNIGSAMLREIIACEGASHDLEMIVRPENKMLNSYLKAGFKIVGEEENYKNTGSKILRLSRPATNKLELAA